MKRLPAKNLLLAAVLGLIFGAAGETLLFLDRQCRQVESLLTRDFRIVAFLSAELPESKLKVLEESIRVIPGLEDLRFVSREAAMSQLESQDKDLSRSVALLGENPLNSAFEIRLADDGLSKTSTFIWELGKLQGLGDIRFKPMEVNAIVQLQFYSRFLRVSMSLAAFLWVLCAAAMLWMGVMVKEARHAFDGVGLRLFLAACGALGGMGLVFLAALPLKGFSAMWVWPAVPEHALLALCGALGGLLPWEWSASRRVEREAPVEESPAFEDLTAGPVE